MHTFYQGCFIHVCVTLACVPQRVVAVVAQTDKYSHSRLHKLSLAGNNFSLYFAAPSRGMRIAQPRRSVHGASQRRDFIKHTEVWTDIQVFGLESILRESNAINT